MGDAVERLGRAIPASWSMSLFPSAGEGSGVFVSARRRTFAGGVRGGAQDPERSRREAGRRAVRLVRRYCAANGLNRLGTLTYAGEGLHDPLVLREDVGVFFRRLRRRVDRDGFAYVWVPEWHKSGHGLHVHFAVGRFVRRSDINEAWGHGFVHIKLLGDLPVGSGAWEEARLAARYLSKYVGKTFEEQRLGQFGLHRYEVAQGFQPQSQRLSGTSPEQLIAQAVDRMGSRPRSVWRSWTDGAGTWDGPSVFRVEW